MTEVRWALLKLSPQTQVKYVECVGGLYPDIDLYYPVYERLVRPHGHARTSRVVRPVYPGYVFVMMGDYDVNKLTRLPVRAWWVKFGGVIELVPDWVVQKIKEFEGRNELVKEYTYVSPYRAGCRVYVHLPMADLLSVIIKVMGHRAVVECPLGRLAVPIYCLEVA